MIAHAVGWAEQQAALILHAGRSLGIDEIALASSVGVAHPERIRILLLNQIPLPEEVQLLKMATDAGLLTSNIAGLTLGYGIYLRHDHYIPRVLFHEFRHVYQYEQAGSITAFLAEYMHQISRYGYEAAPFEVDAKNHETIECCQ